jgi:integrase/recombinase XerC
MAWKQARGEPTDPREPLFRSRKGGPITTRRALQAIHQAAARAGLDGGVGVHSLRKTAATTVMERGVPLRVVQEVLGHAKLETTAAHLGVGRRVLDEATENQEK